MFSAKKKASQPELWIPVNRVTKPAQTSFYAKLDETLQSLGFEEKVRQLCAPAYDQSGVGRPVIVSSHSAELFSDRGIKPSEVALLRPRGSEGTVVELASDKEDVRLLLEGGMTVADAVLPLTAPARIEQLTLFE